MTFFPYRWSWRTVFKNIGWMWYWFTRGVKNVIHWLPVIWIDEPMEWNDLARIMEFKMRQMSRDNRDYGWVVDSPKVARELLVCAELLKRLMEDDYMDLPGIPSKIPNHDGPLTTIDRTAFKRHLARMKEWQELLGKMIGRRFQCWGS